MASQLRSGVGSVWESGQLVSGRLKLGDWGPRYKDWVPGVLDTKTGFLES